MEGHVLFDLDGTITDSGPGIFHAFDYAFRQMQVELPEDFDRRQLVGPPLHDSFARYGGFQGEDNIRAVAFYREYYARQSIFENQLYAGTKDMLEELKHMGFQLYIVARQVTDYLGVTEYFTEIAGSRLDGTREKKEDVIQYLLQQYHMEDRKRILMVGDRKFDVAGAGALGIQTLGVSYGYGSSEELLIAGAWRIVDNPKHLPEAVRLFFEEGER
jgi:phosphoglycolate phosphatase